MAPGSDEGTGEGILHRLTTIVTGLLYDNEGDQTKAGEGRITKTVSYNIHSGKRETTILGGALAQTKQVITGQAYESVLISVVVARKGEAFCTTEEKGGWYLPAGRVDYGECFSSAAVRECMEEASLDVDLQGIMRMEVSFQPQFVRMRCVFAGKPVDEEKPLKSEPDDETFGAEWLTLKEIKRIQKSGRKGRKLRSREVTEMFKWSASGTNIFPMELLVNPRDGKVDNREVITKLHYHTKLLIATEDLQYFLVGKEYQLPKEALKILVPFQDIATDLVINFNDILGEMGKLIGICGIEHSPPESLKLTATGSFCVTYLATVSNGCLESLKNNDTWHWVTFSDFNIMNTHGMKSSLKHIDVTSALIKNASERIVAPLTFIAEEGSPYKKIERTKI